MMQLSITPAHYVALAALLFAIGLGGALLRRNILVVLMSIELMLNAANLTFVAYGRTLGAADADAAAFFVMAIAAAEAAVGLAIVLSAFRTRQSVNLDAFDTLRDHV